MNGATKHEDTSNGHHTNGTNGVTSNGVDRLVGVIGDQRRQSETAFISQEVTKCKPKRIIICCDGTWQDAETLGSPSNVCATNVARLGNVIARAGTDEQGEVWEQVVFYQSGVGTGEETLMSRMIQGGVGLGLLENVIKAYNFIVNNYNPDDKIYIFGFSRGAYTARALAGLVCNIGILQETEMPEFRRQYYNYIRARNFRTAFHNTMAWVNFMNKTDRPDNYAKIDIEVVGVWDTVGALGIPDMGHIWRLDLAFLRRAFQFLDTDLHENIKHAFQALALDECREAFSPTLWTKKKESHTELVQCWFPGAHVNVGGGMQFESDETLAYVSYAWMLDRIRPYLALDCGILGGQMQKMKFAAQLRTQYRRQSHGWIRDGLAYAQAFVFGPTSLPVTEEPDPVAAPIDRMTDWMFNFMTWNTVRTPNQYHRAEAGDVTNEYIHPSAICRYLYSVEHRHLTYIPAALRHWTRVAEVQMQKDGPWTHVQNERDEKGTPYAQRVGWYKYKMDFFGNPVTNAMGQHIVENFLPEYTPSQRRESIENWLLQNSWSGLYVGDIKSVQFSPGMLSFLPTGLHSLIIPDMYRTFNSMAPLVLTQGVNMRPRGAGLIVREAYESTEKGSAVVPSSKTPQIFPPDVNEGTETMKRGKGRKKGQQRYEDEIISTSLPVSAVS